MRHWSQQRVGHEVGQRLPIGCGPEVDADGNPEGGEQARAGFSAEDFIADMGAERTPDALELLYARSRLVMYATAFGLQAIDLVTVNFKEREVLEREALQGAQLGYSGKQVIHPAQIVPVQQVFTPSEQEIAAATRILAEASRYAEAGKGAFSLDGQMVDRPVIKRAESILARAEFSKGK